MLRNRLVLLHHFSELFCPCIPMFDLEQKLAGVGAGARSVSQSDLLRALLVSSAKVTFTLYNQLCAVVHYSSPYPPTNERLSSQGNSIQNCSVLLL